MQYKSIKGISGLGQLGILFAFFGLGFILAGLMQLLIGALIVPPGTPFNNIADEMLKAMLKPENVFYTRLAQVIGTFFLLFFPSVLYLLICHGKNMFWLGFNKRINAWQILIGFFLMFFAGIIANSLEDVSKNAIIHFPGLNALALKLENSYSEQVTLLSNLKSWGEFIMALVIMAFFPALFEEVFFRGALQNLLERWWKAPLMAVIVTSLLFSFIHMSIYLFLSRAVLGFILGLMYQRSRNIWVNIAAHFLNNAIALIGLFWLSQQKQKIDPGKLDPHVPIWGALVTVAVVFGLFMLFEKVSAKNRLLLSFEEQNLIEKDNPIHSIAQN